MDWTEETIVRLRGLWAEGHSTAEIGRRLGVTKNAVVGKAHRLDLPARPSPIRRDGAPGAQPRRPAPRRVAGPTLPPLSSSSQGAAALPQAPVARAEPAMNSVHPVNTHPMGAPPINPGLATVMTPRPEVSRPEHERAAADVMRSPAPPPRVQVAPRPYARSLTCCWPIGEPGTKSFRFCDDGAVGGKPYCAAHAAVAYVKVRDRREDAA